MSIDEQQPVAPTDEVAERYLDLLAGCLTRSLFGEGFQAVDPPRDTLKGRLWHPVRGLLRKRGWQLVRPAPFDPELRSEGRDWPFEAETMVGLRRLDNLRHCVRQVVADGVPGDLIECGVWRGGAAIFMRAALAAYRDGARRVWLADSFAGLPPPDPERYPADTGDRLHAWGQLAVPIEEVKANFARYGLLDDRVGFLEGWFRDTLPTAPVGPLAVLRADGDMYESTTQVLDSLYDRVSPGGFVIIDDYGAIPACRAAVEDFRSRTGVTERLHWIDWTGVYWRRGERSV